MKNRVQSLIEQFDEYATSGTTSVESAVHSRALSTSSHSFFTPLHYEPNYAYPLLVWLHGDGSSENQLKKIIPLVSTRNYVAVAPRGTVVADEDDRSSGYRWIQSPKHIARAGQRVMDSIERAQQKFNVAANRVFLAGSDTGGTMAFRLAMQFPHRFAGVLSIGGGFPTSQAPLSRLQEVRRLNLFVACGRHAQQYTSDEVCRNLRLFHSAGISVTVRQYPCGDEIIPQMLSDMDRWVMDQILPPQPAAEPQRPLGGLN